MWCGVVWNSTEIVSSCGHLLFFGIKKYGNNSFEPAGYEDSAVNWWNKEWAEFEPNGGHLQKCVVLSLDTGEWFDKSCFDELCSLCHFERTPTYHARGLCKAEEAKEDWTFFLEETFQESNEINSLGENMIKYDSKLPGWNVINMKRNTVLVSLKQTNRKLPFGEKNWTINALDCEDKNKSITLRITLVSCV